MPSRMLRPLRLDQPTDGSIARRGAVGAVGVAAQGLVRFFTTTLVGRLGGPSVLGLVQPAISTALLLSLLWPTTTGSAASKFVAAARGAQDDARAQAVAAHLARRALLTTALLAALAVPVWMTIDGGTWRGGLCVSALVTGWSLYSFTRGLQFGAGQVTRAAGWDVAAGALGLLALVLALVLGRRDLTLLLPLAAAYSLYAAASWPWRARGRPPAALRRELDGFVALGVAGTVASTGFLQLSQIVAKLAAGDFVAGQYAAALGLATPISLLAATVSLVLFPSMAEAWGRGDVEGFRRQTDQATRLLVLLMVLLMGSLALCSRLVVRLLFGEEFTDAASLLPVLLLAVLASTLGVASVNALSTRSQRGMALASGASVAGLLTGLSVWAALSARGLTLAGVAAGYLCGTVVLAGVPFVTVWRRDGHRWAPLVLRLATGLTLAVALVLVQRSTGASHWTDPAFALGFAAVWLALCSRDLPRLSTLVSRPGPPTAAAAADPPGPPGDAG